MNEQVLKKAGLKATLPRLRVLEILQNSNKTHFSAEDIHKELMFKKYHIGLSTVYRVLAQFESAKLLVSNTFSDNISIFELNTGKHHDHMVCKKCGKIVEFLDETIEKRQSKIAKQKGYKITNHVLFIYGICPDCQTHIKATH